MKIYIPLASIVFTMLMLSLGLGTTMAIGSGLQKIMFRLKIPVSVALKQREMSLNEILFLLKRLGLWSEVSSALHTHKC